MGWLKRRKEDKKTYNILCVADHEDPLVYSDNIKSRFKKIDFIISAGDLPLKYYDFIVSSLNKELYFVFGNHNLKKMDKYKLKISQHNPLFVKGYETEYFLYSAGSIYMGGKIRKHKSLLLAGLDGSIWYNGGKGQYTELQMALHILALIPGLLWNRLVRGRFLDILITHAPPFCLNDRPDRCHRGFKVFLWFLRTFKPAYQVHGHIHLYNRNAKRRVQYYDTCVVNAYDHTVLQFEG